MEKKLLNTLHEQFAINQNHHQDLFIKFLIALFALFGTWGYVALNTNPEQIENVLCSVCPHSFSHKTLLFTTLIVEAIFTLLILIIVNIGYGYRRDHLINYKIRHESMKDNYDKFFKNLYSPFDKKFNSFLPGFYEVFFWFIFISQIFIFLTSLLIDCSNDCICNLSFNCIEVILLFLIICTIIISLWKKISTFLKYQSQINISEHKNQ